MPEDTTPAQAATTEPAQAATTTSAQAATTATERTEAESEISKEENARLRRETTNLRERFRQTEEELNSLRAQYEEAVNSTQSDSEKVKSKIAKLEAQVQAEKTARIEAERLRMAQSAASRYDVPEEFLPALRGDTQDEIDESAKALQKVFLVAAKKLAQTVPPNPEGGDKSALTAQANGKLTAEQQAQNRREYAQKF